MTLFSGANVDVPAGVILPFDGSADNTPPGWVFCDGNNGTPDLRSKYVKCVPNIDTDPGATGGSQSVSLSESELPSHSHSASFGTTGSHTHVINRDDDAFGDNDQNSDGWVDYGSSSADRSNSTEGAGSHSHTFNVGTTGNGTTGDSFTNEPKRRNISYIQKL